jgi:PEP-CTERM motif
LNNSSGEGTWQLVDNKEQTLAGWNWVDATDAGLGNAVIFNTETDNRGYFELTATVTANASGVARIDLRLPQMLSDGSAQDKWHLDGYALTAVPEPGTYGIAFGLGLGFLIALRRRKMAQA